ncbi:MAG: FkbM family methyltransferase [Paludibacter sp.]
MKISDNFWFYLAKEYSRLYGFLKDNFNIRIRGLGFMLRRIKIDRQLCVSGHQLYFAHEMAEAYARPLHGKWNEPETHMLISLVMDKLKVTFIEVGANIGEILIDIAAHSSCVKAIAFEPNLDAVAVIDNNIKLNNLGNCTVLNKALGHEKSRVKMSFGSHSPSASLLSIETSTDNLVDVEVSTLDSELDDKILTDSSIILLIDVEGYELNVIRGGFNLIRNLKPLIIFEYHQETKKSFSLNKLQIELGDLYKIHRVRKDSMLDDDVENAWNCVAIPCNSQFESVLTGRIIG